MDSPKSVTDRKLKKGQWIWACDNEITVNKWKDKREVISISNAHFPELVEVTNRNGKKKIKPNVIKDYNEGMSGVDRSDQMLSYNSSLKNHYVGIKKLAYIC